MDVFFCALQDAGDLRAGMALTCIVRWEMELDARLRPMSPAKGEEAEFQMKRRMVADSLANGPIYIVADDDCLPESPDPFIQVATKIMERHPEFAILSMWPANSVLQRWTPEGDYKPHEDDEVMEHVSVGGIRFCRKGILKKWPQMVGKTYDSQHCQAIRDAGFRSGYFKELKMNHLGRNYSTVWP